jgi:hypothetical protein
MNVVKMINSVVYVKLEVLTSVLYSESSECRDLMFYNRNVRLNHSYISLYMLKYFAALNWNVSLIFVCS